MLSALQHDSIIDAGDPDYALVEGEADRVAKQAVKDFEIAFIIFLYIYTHFLKVQMLKTSRRDCWNAQAGVPTWTGSSGVIRTAGSPEK